MEWTPEQNASNPKSHSTWSGLKPQLFFAPQDNQKTGLEEPLSSVSLSIRDSNVYKKESNKDNKRMMICLTILIVLPLVALLEFRGSVIEVMRLIKIR